MPRPVDGELVRHRLIASLSTRWQRPVSTVVASAGFGKTTLLAQAVRVNECRPAGVDHWVACTPSDRDPRYFTAAILDALNAGRTPSSGSDRVGDIVAALADAAPLDVCLIFDDVHELGDDTSSSQVLDQLLRELPMNGHVVLAGRSLPRLSLARRRAGGDVQELNEEDLAFTPQEVETVAEFLGCAAPPATALGGWPALVRLAMAAGSSSPLDFLAEEVLAGLDDGGRLDLLALTSLGVASADDIEAVTGRAADLAQLARTVPLIDRLDDDRYRAHDLWTDAVRRVVPSEQAVWAQRAAIESLLRGDRLAAAGDLAIRANEWALLARAGAALVSRSLSTTPLDVAQSWLDAIPQGYADEPEMLLVQAAVAWGRDYTDVDVDGWTDAAFSSLVDAGKTEWAVAALGLAVVAAESRADLARLWTLVERAQSISHLRSEPVVGFLQHSAAAVVAELSGDPELALDELDKVDLSAVPGPMVVAVHRLLMHCSIMAGRADEIMSLVSRLEQRPGHGEWSAGLAIARWFAGDATGYVGIEAESMGTARSGSRDIFREHSIGAIVRACGGHVEPETSMLDPALAENSREAALLTTVAASRAIVTGEERRAAELLDRFLHRFPLSDRLGERHLRRFLAIHYVLNQTVRRTWDGVELGPVHQRSRRVARALVDTRAGKRVSDIGDITPEQVFCNFPLPWSIELAVRLTNDDDPYGVALAQWLADFVGQTVIDRIRGLVDHQMVDGGDGRLVTGAKRLLEGLSVAPNDELQIRVLGSFAVRWRSNQPNQPDQWNESGELRRRRVRELVAALIVHRSLSRDRLIELLWPDLDLVKAQQNLRVTLTYVRRVLEPERRRGEPGYHLRTDGDRVQLFESAMLDVDLWRFERYLNEASVARDIGAHGRYVDALQRAVEAWQGRPSEELWSTADLSTCVETLCLRFVDAAITLGEQRLAEDRVGDAADLAAAALIEQPYDERALRLSLAASLRAGNPATVSRSVDRLQAALDDIGVQPELSTQVLLTRAQPMSAVY